MIFGKIELPNDSKLVVGLNHAMLKEVYANPGRRNRFSYYQTINIKYLKRLVLKYHLLMLPPIFFRLRSVMISEK